MILLHAGNEYHPFPSPRLMETCRFFVEQGAGAVICHHTHCPGCWEEYRGGHIVYGQGNLIYGNPGAASSWNEVFWSACRFPPPARRPWNSCPTSNRGEDRCSRKLQGAAAAAFLETVAQRSRQIQEAGFLHDRWVEFCEGRRGFYLSVVLGHGRVLGWLNRHGKLVRYLILPARCAGCRAMIHCEAHREVLETLLLPPD